MELVLFEVNKTEIIMQMKQNCFLFKLNELVMQLKRIFFLEVDVELKQNQFLCEVDETEIVIWLKWNWFLFTVDETNYLVDFYFLSYLLPWGNVILFN